MTNLRMTRDNRTVVNTRGCQPTLHPPRPTYAEPPQAPLALLGRSLDHTLACASEPPLSPPSAAAAAVQVRAAAAPRAAAAAPAAPRAAAAATTRAPHDDEALDDGLDDPRLRYCAGGSRGRPAATHLLVLHPRPPAAPIASNASGCGKTFRSWATPHY